MHTDFLFVLLGGALGAMSRYGFSIFIKRLVGTEFPLATFLVNILGSFLLGALLAMNLPSPLYLLTGVGFMGSFTTFSTFQLENLTLYRKRKYKMLAVYLISSVFVSILAALAGFSL